MALTFSCRKRDESMMPFVSNKVEQVADGHPKVTGDPTIRAVSRENDISIESMRIRQAVWLR